MLEYTLTEDDLVAFAAGQARESGEDAVRRRRAVVVIAWLVGVAAYLLVSALSTIPLLAGRQFVWAGAAEVTAIIVGVAVGWRQWRSGERLVDRWLSRRYRRLARVALEQTGAHRRVWLTADGIRVASGGREDGVDWAGVVRVTETPDHVFVHTAANSAHIIPKRAGAGVAGFVAEVRARTG